MRMCFYFIFLFIYSLSGLFLVLNFPSNGVEKRKFVSPCILLRSHSLNPRSCDEKLFGVKQFL